MMGYLLNNIMHVHESIFLYLYIPIIILAIMILTIKDKLLHNIIIIFGLLNYIVTYLSLIIRSFFSPTGKTFFDMINIYFIPTLPLFLAFITSIIYLIKKKKNMPVGEKKYVSFAILGWLLTFIVLWAISQL
jgi:hypothetical protein